MIALLGALVLALWLEVLAAILAFRPGAPRRSPWPYSCKLNGTPLLLGRGQGPDGRPLDDLVITETADLARVAPTTFEYGATDPEGNRVQPYGRWPKGFGLRQQVDFDDGRYDHTINALVYGDTWTKGPDIATLTPATTDTGAGVDVRGFDLGGATYVLMGRYVLKRDSDAAWSVSKDLGAGKRGRDAVTFHSNALAGNRAFVALDTDGPDWHFDGTTWTQFATFQSLAYGTVGRELYRASDTNLVSKVNTNADPTVEANWTAANQFRIGDKASAITRLFVNAAGVLVIVKTDGIYSLDGAGQDIRYFPFHGSAPSADAGKGGGPLLNDLYLPFRSGLYRLRPDFVLEPEAGPEEQHRTTWLASVRTTAFQGHDSLFGIAAITDETDAYLMLLVGGVWHGAISVRFVSKKISALWKSTAGAVANHARLYLGFSDGSVGWLTLPNTHEWAADTAATFSTADGELYPALFTGQVPNDPKPLYALVVNGPKLDASNSVLVDYRTDPQAAWTALGNTFDGIRERAAFPNATSGVLVGLRFVLKSTLTTATPQVGGAGLHHAWRPDRRPVYTFFVLAEDGLTNWLGVPLRLGRTKIRSVVRAARDAQGSVALVLPDHTSQQVTVTRLRENVRAWDDRTRQWRAALELRAVQFGENAVYGTYGRTEAYTYGQLEGFGTYGRLESL